MQNMDKKILNLSEDEAIREKKKIASRCINLECKKEQLSILIEKLYKISGERINLLPDEHEQNIISKCVSEAGLYLFSIADQLRQALKSRKEIEKEISLAKNKINLLDNILKNKEQG